MWETICDAWACWSGWNFGPNSTVYPYSVEYPPPPKMKIVRESKSEYRIPPPPKIEVKADLGTLRLFSFQLQNTPPPQIEI